MAQNVTNLVIQTPTHVPQISEALDEKLNNIDGGNKKLENLILDILAVQVLLRKEGQFLTKHAFRQAQQHWRDAVEVLAESYTSTWGRNTTWVSAAIGGIGALAGHKEIGDAASHGLNAQNQHWSQTEAGARNILSYAVEKLKNQTESTKYTTQNEQQQVDESRQMIARVQQALHDAMTALSR